MAAAGAEEWLTPKQAADYLRVSPATVYRWAQQGILVPARLPSGYRRYRRSEVEQLYRDMYEPGAQDK